MCDTHWTTLGRSKDRVCHGRVHNLLLCTEITTTRSVLSLFTRAFIPHQSIHISPPISRPDRSYTTMAEPTHTNGTNGVAHANGNTNGSSAPSHPLGPLSATEITLSSELIKAVWPADISLHFRVITLSEPRKAELAPYLLAERAGETKPSIDRRAFVVYYLRGTVSAFSFGCCAHTISRAVTQMMGSPVVNPIRPHTTSVSNRMWPCAGAPLR